LYYESTRNNKLKKKFCEVLLEGLADDGGLYVPKKWPKVTKKELSKFKNMNYQQIAFYISKKFIENEINDKDLKKIIRKSFINFSKKSIATHKDLGNNKWILELFHGPTLAFKDYALQVVGNLFEHVLKKEKKRITIIGATSGDTGSAAIDACKNKSTMELFIFHPYKKVSNIQRRLMTTVKSKNIHNVAIRGNFDDCQKIVKKLFVDEELKNKFYFSAINSINWARILFQLIYYFYSVSKINVKNEKCVFSVPSGNFGNVYSGYVAKKIGLPIDKLIIATNKNDVLSTFTNKGYIKLKSVKQTISPSMDIQLPSNLERFIYDLFRKNNKLVLSELGKLYKNRRISIKKDKIRQIQNYFKSSSVNEKNTLLIIQEFFCKNKIILDPHTAVGIAAERKIEIKNKPVIYISTAHPAKFPETIAKAIKRKVILPKNHKSLLKSKENYKIINLNYSKIKDYLIKESRFVKNV
jgi:threonine synthase